MPLGRLFAADDRGCRKMKFASFACGLMAAALLSAPVAAKAANIFTLRLFNADDLVSAYIFNSHVHDQLILQANFLEDTGFVDVSAFFAPGANNILITDFNAGGTWSYGFDFK